MNRIIAVNTNCYHGYSLEESLAGIAEAGFHYVELTATKGWTEHVFPDQSLKELLKVRRLMRKLNLKTAGLSGHCNLMDPDRIPDFMDNIELAAFFDSPFIVSSVGEAHLKDKAVSGIDGLTRNIRELLPLLDSLDMKLVLEAHGDHATAAALMPIIEAVGSPRVGINYDTANVIFYGDVDPEKDIRECLDQVAYLHLKDKAGDRKAWDFPALGEGYVRFPEIFEILKSAGNNAPFSIEIEFTEKGPASLDEVNDAVRRSADYLTKRGFAI
jgi:sugar phosphate isomerase/epimerase